MQKYSHTSRRVQKELGGDANALSGRVDSIETEIGHATYTGDSITDAISDAQADINRFKDYELKTVKSFTFDITTATEQTLKEVLENREVVDWFKGSHRSEWTRFQISGQGNTTLNGEYDKTFSSRKYAISPLTFNTFGISAAGEAVMPQSHTLKANTINGEISYVTATLDITGSYTKIFITFKKGELS